MSSSEEEASSSSSKGTPVRNSSQERESDNSDEGNSSEECPDESPENISYHSVESPQNDSSVGSPDNPQTVESPDHSQTIGSPNILKTVESPDKCLNDDYSPESPREAAEELCEKLPVENGSGCEENGERTIASPDACSRPCSPKKGIDFTADFSDVSDIDSADDIPSEEKKEEVEKKKAPAREVGLQAEGEEQLDFEAEEDGECAASSKEKHQEEGKKSSDLEDGEISDEDDKSEPTPTCKFFFRGNCTWGSNCRFVHQGVTNKGNYSMFEMNRPVLSMPATQSPKPLSYPIYPPVGLPMQERPLITPLVAPPMRKEEPVETAWERGLRQAKEMIKQSSKRKETDVDFEDKKMNLKSDDKEIDYYSGLSPNPERKEDVRGEYGPDVPGLGYHYPPMHHPVMPRGHDYWPHRGLPPYDDYHIRPHLPPPPPYPPGPEYYPGRRYPPMHPGYYGQRLPPHGGPMPISGPGDDYFDRKAKMKGYVSRGDMGGKDKPLFKDVLSHRSRRDSSPRTRGDEWSDPWMRAKSPGSKGKRRYSSKSSYSSSSGSSSSRSSSRSRSGSKSPIRKSNRPIQIKLSPSSRGKRPSPPTASRSVTPIMTERDRTVAVVRPPSPKVVKLKYPVPSDLPPLPTLAELARSSPSKRGIPPQRFPQPKPDVVPPKPRSSSSSSESSSNSDSSESSSSSISGKSSPMRRRLAVKDESKVDRDKKGVLSRKENVPVSKPGAKIAVSRNEVNSKDRRTAKRPRSPSAPKSDGSASDGKKPKPAGSRIELLKQLKAVEDAIARKRSKPEKRGNGRI